MAWPAICKSFDDNETLARSLCNSNTGQSSCSCHVTTMPLLHRLSQASQISFEPSYVRHMWCRSDLALLSWVKLCVSLECIHMSAASPEWWRGGQPCQKSSWCSTVLLSPTRDAWAHLFRYVSLALRHEETVTEASGTRQSLAELNRLCLKAQWQEISLRSQKAALIASDMCIPFPSDATSLFCLDHLCNGICIYV